MSNCIPYLLPSVLCLALLHHQLCSASNLTQPSQSTIKIPYMMISPRPPYTPPLIALPHRPASPSCAGTIAGQVVLRGFMNINLPTWLRRLTTRGAAVLPAALLQAYGGDRLSYRCEREGGGDAGREMGVGCGGGGASSCGTSSTIARMRG